MQTVDNATFLAEMQAAGITSRRDGSGSRLADTTRQIGSGRGHGLHRISPGSFPLCCTHVAPTAYCDAWRPGGIWHEDDPAYTDSVREVLLRGFDIPHEHCGALSFARSDAAAVTALVLAFAVAGWNINDDLCLVPDKHQFIIRVSHHAVLHVSAEPPSSWSRWSHTWHPRVGIFPPTFPILLQDSVVDEPSRSRSAYLTNAEAVKGSIELCALRAHSYMVLCSFL